ncbi:MAG: HK97 family phage prohead protease [Hyphomicrobium sp.]|nr:HK97 family phage prohead protease [Hyphomicrobium sp.]
MLREYGHLVDIEEKGVVEGDDVWTITGYASVFGNEDLGGDVVVKGAFADSLAKRGMPLFFFNHKMEDAPIGAIVDAKEDARGLWFKGELPKDDAFVAKRLIPQVKRRGLKGVSIGYRVKQKSMKGGLRHIEKADLFEISLVNMPMNPEATVSTVKSERLGIKDWNEFSDREREAHLKAVGISDELAKRIVRLDRDGRGEKSRREAGEGKAGVFDLAGMIRNTAEGL